MRLLVYDMLVNVNGICYVHICEQARWARSVGNSAIENVCIIIILFFNNGENGSLKICWMLFSQTFGEVVIMERTLS